MNLADLINAIEKSIKRNTHPSYSNEHHGRISSGINKIDQATGGGIERGYLAEIYGASLSGKTALAYQYIKSLNNYALLMDINNSFDYDKAIKMGIDTEKLIVAKLTSPEEICIMVRAVASLNLVHLIVIDDLASINYPADLKEANSVTSFKTDLQDAISGSMSAVLIINQIRTKPGYGDVPYGPRTSRIESLSIQTTRLGALSKKHQRVGCRIRVDIRLSRTHVPGECTILDILFDGGIDYGTIQLT